MARHDKEGSPLGNALLIGCAFAVGLGGAELFPEHREFAVAKLGEAASLVRDTITHRSQGLVDAAAGQGGVRTETVVPSAPVVAPSASVPSPVPSQEKTSEVGKNCLDTWPVADKYTLGVIVPVNVDGSYYGDKGKTNPEKTRELLKKYKIGGAIVMNNVASRSKNAQNLLALRAAGVELSTDQEGGKVQRFSDAGLMPAQKDVVARKMTAEEVTRMAKTQYEMLRTTYGITRVLGPVLDLAPASGKPSKIGDSRIFSGDVATVAAYGAAYINAAKTLGMLSTVKHFGGGSMSVNTDAGAASVPSRDVLRRRDWLPYAAPEIKKSETTIMITSAIPEGDTLPAVLNPLVYQELRNNFGTPDTTTMSDDLGAPALTASGDLPTVIVEATAAGLDYKEFVQGHPSGKSLEAHLTNIIQAGERAVQSGKIPADTLDNSVRRILKNRGLSAACIKS